MDVASSCDAKLTKPLILENFGTTSRSRSIPGWLVWIKYISSFFYGFEALSVNQWKDVEGISCGLASDDACLNDGAEVLEFYDLDEVTVSGLLRTWTRTSMGEGDSNIS